MNEEQRAIGRTAFVMQLARDLPEFRPPERTAEEYGKAFAMAPLWYLRQLQAIEERRAA